MTHDQETDTLVILYGYIYILQCTGFVMGIPHLYCNGFFLTFIFLIYTISTTILYTYTRQYLTPVTMTNTYTYNIYIHAHKDLLYSQCTKYLKYGFSNKNPARPTLYKTFNINFVIALKIHSRELST